MKPSAIVSFVLLASCFGCASGGGDRPAMWSDSIGHDRDLIYEHCILVMEEQGFEIDRDRSIRGAGTIVTRWNVQLAPFRYQGIRRRAHLLVERAPALRGADPKREQPYRVGVRVEIERNKTIQDPMNPALAEWEPGEHDSTHEERMLFWLRQAFKDW